MAASPPILNIEEFEYVEPLRKGVFCHYSKYIHKQTKEFHVFATMPLMTKAEENIDAIKNTMVKVAEFKHPLIIPVKGFIITNDNILHIISSYPKEGSYKNASLELKSDKVIKSSSILNIAAAMVVLHKNGFIVGDLCQNSIYYSDDYFKLGDWAAAQFPHSFHVDRSSFEVSMWFAPELAEKPQLTKKSDIYALGSLLFSFYVKFFTTGRKSCKSKDEKSAYEMRPNVPTTIPVFARRLFHLCWRAKPETRPNALAILNMLLINYQFIYFLVDNKPIENVVQTISNYPEIRSKLEQEPPPSPVKKVVQSYIFPTRRTDRINLISHLASVDFLTDQGKVIFASYIHLQYLLTILEVSRISEAATAIVNSIFFTSREFVYELINNIVYATICQYNSLLELSLLTKELSKSTNKLAELIKPLVIKRIFSINNKENPIPNRIGQAKFLYFLVKVEFFTQKEAVSFLADFRDNHKPFKTDFIVFFAHIPNMVEQYNPSLYQTAIGVLKDLCKQTFVRPEIKSFQKYLPLYKKNNWKLLKEAIEKGYSPKPIVNAIRHDDWKTVREEILTNPKIDPNYLPKPEIFDACPITHDNLRIIHLAAVNGATKAFQTIQTAGADFSANDDQNRSYVVFCAISQEPSLIDFIDDHKTSWDGVFGNVTRLHRFDVFDRLVRIYHFKPAKPDRQGELFLPITASSNNVSHMVYCVMNDVNINLRETFGWTSLHWAVFKSRHGVIRVLLEMKNVDFMPVDVFGATPLHIAAGNADSLTVSLILSQKSVDRNQKDNKGRTPLHCAVYGCRTENVRVLLKDKGVRKRVKDNKGRTAKDIAIKYGFKQIVELF